MNKYCAVRRLDGKIEVRRGDTVILTIEKYFKHSEGIAELIVSSLESQRKFKVLDELFEI